MMRKRARVRHVTSIQRKLPRRQDMGGYLCRRWGGVWLRLPDMVAVLGYTKRSIRVKVTKTWRKATRRDYALYARKRRAA